MDENNDFRIEPKYLTAEQCATRFAISLRHFKYLVAAGQMPKPLKFGRSARWPLEILQEFESEKTQEHYRPWEAKPRNRNPKRK